MTVAIVGRDDTGCEKEVEGVFSTTGAGLRQFWGFARKYKPVTFIMEATNVYHQLELTLDA
ncbi:MAG: hypothetical protein ACTSUE_23825 [Promethearchaeota archaeon]